VTGQGEARQSGRVGVLRNSDPSADCVQGGFRGRPTRPM